jgi:hypothetical protein
MLDFPERFYSLGAVFYGIPGIVMLFLVIPATLKFLGQKYPHILKSEYNGKSK